MWLPESCDYHLKRITSAIYVSCLMVRLIARISRRLTRKQTRFRIGLLSRIRGRLNRRGGGGKNQISAGRVPLTAGEQHKRRLMRSRTRVSGGPAPAQPEAAHVLCSFKAIRYSRLAIRYSRLAIPDGSALLIESPDCLVFAGKLQAAILRLARRPKGEKSKLQRAQIRRGYLRRRRVRRVFDVTAALRHSWKIISLLISERSFSRLR